MVLERAKGLVPVFCLWIGVCCSCCCGWVLRGGNNDVCCRFWLGGSGNGDKVAGSVEYIELMVVAEACGNDEVVAGA